MTVKTVLHITDLGVGISTGTFFLTAADICMSMDDCRCSDLSVNEDVLLFGQGRNFCSSSP